MPCCFVVLSNQTLSLPYANLPTERRHNLTLSDCVKKESDLIYCMGQTAVPTSFVQTPVVSSIGLFSDLCQKSWVTYFTLEHSTLFPSCEYLSSCPVFILITVLLYFSHYNFVKSVNLGGVDPFYLFFYKIILVLRVS